MKIPKRYQIASMVVSARPREYHAWIDGRFLGDWKLPALFMGGASDAAACVLVGLGLSGCCRCVSEGIEAARVSEDSRSPLSPSSEDAASRGANRRYTTPMNVVNMPGTSAGIKGRKEAREEHTDRGSQNIWAAGLQ